jgi:hypothetical protein
MYRRIWLILIHARNILPALGFYIPIKTERGTSPINKYAWTHYCKADLVTLCGLPDFCTSIILCNPHPPGHFLASLICSDYLCRQRRDYQNWRVAGPDPQELRLSSGWRLEKVGHLVLRTTTPPEITMMLWWKLASLPWVGQI